MKNTNYLHAEGIKPMTWTTECGLYSCEEVICNHDVEVIVEPDIIVTYCSKCGEILDTVVRKKMPENSPCPTSPTSPTIAPAPSHPTVEPTPWWDPWTLPWTEVPATDSNAITGTGTATIHANANKRKGHDA